MNFKIYQLTRDRRHFGKENDKLTLYLHIKKLLKIRLCTNFCGYQSYLILNKKAKFIAEGQGR